MPITPPAVRSLLATYDAAVSGATELVDLVTSVAPAGVADVVCRQGQILEMFSSPFAPFRGPGTLDSGLFDLGGILQGACNMPEDVPPPIETGFTGGQCLVNYIVTTQATNFGGQQDPIALLVPGPVVGIERRRSEDGSSDAIVLLAGGGDFVRSLTSGRPQDVSAVILSVVRQDGLPDDCGNPVENPAPPSGPIVQPPRSSPIPRIGPGGEALPPVIIAPIVGQAYIDVDATIQVPVVINFIEEGDGPTFSIPVKVSLPDFNVEFSFGGQGGRDTGDGEPSEPTPPTVPGCDEPDLIPLPGNPETPEEDPMSGVPPGFRIVGIVLNSSRVNGTSRETVLGTAMPPLLVPRIATVQFQIDSGVGLFLAPEVQVKTGSAFIPAPADVQTVRAFVGFEPGWDGSFQYLVARTTTGREDTGQDDS